MAEGGTQARMCLLDESKVCDDCGECDRCDLDPNKICDNCCKCLAIEDADSEFRTVTIDGKSGSFDYEFGGKSKPAHRHAGGSKAAPSHDDPELTSDISDEPQELTEELVEYWERKLAEYGEAPADDGFGEVRVSTRVPVSGTRERKPRRSNRHIKN